MPVNLVCPDISRIQKDNDFYVIKEAWQISLTKFKQALRTKQSKIANFKLEKFLFVGFEGF